MMNRIYKVIFNTSLGLYQVVSEIARNHGKSSSSTGRKAALVPFVLSALLGFGLSGTAMAADPEAAAPANGAVTMKEGDQLQLQGTGAASVSSKSQTDETSGKTTTTITVAVPTNGEVAKDNTGLVTGGTVYTAVNAEQTARVAADTTLTNKIGTLDANGNYIQKDGSLSSNLSTLDTHVKTNADAISKETIDRETAVTNVTNTVNTLSDSAVKYDDDSNKGKVTLAGEGGTAITNVKDGALSDSSTDAVTGKQLYAEQTARVAADTTLTNKIGTLDANGNYIQKDGSLSSNLSTLDTHVKTNADAISKEVTDRENAVTNEAAARTSAINALETKLTSGSTNSLVSKANVDASNIGTKIDTSSETTEEAKKKKQEDNAKLWGQALGIGTIAADNEELLTGGTLYTELRPSADGFYIYNGKSTAYNLLALDSAINALGVEKVTDNSGNITYVSNLYKYFKANPETTTNDDGTVTYATDADAQGSNSVAIGPSAKVNTTGENGVAIGKGATTGADKYTKTLTDKTTTEVSAAGGVDSVSIGTNAASQGNDSVALGKGAQVLNDFDSSTNAAVVKTGDVAIGSGATVDSSLDSTAIGTSADVRYGENSLALGSSAKVDTAKQAVALGYKASVADGADGSLALGDEASAKSSYATAIGYKASANTASSIAMGNGANTGGDGGGIAIGTSTTADGRSIAIGFSGTTTANNYDSVAIGNGAQANVDRSISIGLNAGTGAKADKGGNEGSLIAIGDAAGQNVAGLQNTAIGSGAGSGVKSSNNIALGSYAGSNITNVSDNNPQNGYNISIGYQANYSKTNQTIIDSLAIGRETSAITNGVALGATAKASGQNSVSLGFKAQSSGTDSMALGSGASAADGNVAIGSSSAAPAVSTLGTVKDDGNVYKAETSTDSSGAVKTTYTLYKSALTNIPLSSTSHYVSFGISDGNTTVNRRLSNVADGVFDQDAVTVKQLNTAYSSLQGLIKGIDTSTLNTYSTDVIDSKEANLKAEIANSKYKYFSVNADSATSTGNQDNTGASSGGADAMAIGPNAYATATKSLAVGNNVSASGVHSIALGTSDNPTTTAGATTTHYTSSEGENSIAVGYAAIAQTDNSIAIGTRAVTYTADTSSRTPTKTGINSIAIGYETVTRKDYATAIGNSASAKGTESTALGNKTTAEGTESLAVGSQSTTNGDGSASIGRSNKVTGTDVAAVGSGNISSGSWGGITDSGLFGYTNKIQAYSDTNVSNTVTGVYALGSNNEVDQANKINKVTNVTLLGQGNIVTAGSNATSYQNTINNVTVIGGSNTVKGYEQPTTSWSTLENDTVLGYGNTIDASQQATPVSNIQILGNKVTAALGNSVYLGTAAAYVSAVAVSNDAETLAVQHGDADAEASDEYKAAATDTERNTIKQKYEAKYLYKARVAAMKASGTTAGVNQYDQDNTYGNASSYTYAAGTPTGVITVGSVGSERRIQNVAAGLVSASSTDAINGSQLYALTRQIRFGGDNSSFGKTTAAEDQNVVARGSDETISITGGSDAVTSSTADGTTTYTVDAAKLTGNNIAVVADKDANALHVQLASNLKDLNTAQLGSGRGDSYKETIKLDGTDTTNGGTLELKDATGANGVTLRTSGTTTTADVNGTATTRLLVNDKTVATTDDGLKFGGDTENTSALKLNSKLTIKGGADTTKLTDNNIGVVSAGNGTLTVKLSKNVNLGMDGSLTTGTVTATAVTADTVTSGNSTLNTNGLTITNGPSVLATGINAGSKKITNVSDGEANADAANYGQVKAAKTTLSQGNNNVTITPNTASEDGHTNYTVSVSNLYYKAGTDTTAKDVALATGLTFNNGKNTTAVAGDNGIITYNLNDKIELGAETDSNNHIVVDGTKGLLTLGMNATINGNAGTASIGGVSIGKSGSDQVITGLTNKIWTVGTTQAVDGRAATENQLQSVADNLNTANTNIATLQHGFKVQANGDTTTESTVKADDALNFTAGDNAKVTTTKNSKQITISVDNLSVKDNNGTAQSVKLAEGLNFQDGTNTTAKVGTSGIVTYDLKDSITLGNSTDETNRIIVNGTNGTITAGNLATINGNAGTASIGGVSIGKSGNDQTVTGLSNRTWVVGESTAVNGRAATEDQLQSVSNAAHTNADNITTLQQGFTVTANNDNDKKSTIKAGDKLNFQAGKNVQVSTTADSKSIEVALSDTPEFTTVTAKDANGNITTVSGTGVTITPTGTGTQSVSLTSEGLDNGNHVIRNVASGGTVRTNAANIGDLQDAISNASTTTTNTGFNVKGDDATAQKVKLGKQLNVVGGTTDSTQLSTGNIGVETTADAEGNATLTVKLKKDIALDSVTTGSTTLNTSGVTNGNMSLTATGMTITNTDASKQVSVTTSGVSMGSQRIQNVADAMSDTDAATLKQVKNARTKVAAGSNVAGVDSSEDTATHQMTYTVNVDNLSVKANTEAPKSVTLKKGLTFNNGTNTTASVSDDGEVKYDLNSTLTGLTSVTAGNSTLNTNGLTIKDGAATKVEITSGNVTMGGNVIHNVGAGQVGTDAVNKDQLDALQNQVSGGWNLAGYNAEGTTVTAKIGAGKTVTYGDGNYTKSVVTKDDSTGNATVKVDVTTGTFGSGTGDKAGTVISTTNGLATTQDVASAINSASISVVADNTPENKTAVKAGDTIHFAKDENLTLTQNGTTFTYGLNKEISISKVTTSDTTKGSTVQTAEGVTTTDAAGNTYIQNGQGITLTPSDKTKSPVKLTNTGLNNGGNKITGVGKGTDDTDAVNVSQLEEVRKQVGSGWQIADNNGTKVADIGAGRKVSFKTDSQYLTAKTETAGTDAANVTYGLKTKALEAASGKVSSVDTAEDGLATAKNVADTINQTYWTAASGKSGSGSQTDETTNAADKQISAGDTVTFNAGNNLSLIQNGAFFTYGLQTDLTGMNTITFTPRSDTDGRSISLVIGKQKDGVNTDEGYYITGLDNTTWNQSNYVGNRAATEAQLASAIKQVTLASQSGGFKLSDDNNKEVSQVLGQAIGVVGDGNITTIAETTTTDINGHIKVSLNKNIDLGTDGSVTIGSSSITNGQAKIGRVTVNGTDNTVSGLANTEWKTENVNVEASAGGYKGSTKAATESQLAEAISTATTMAAQNEQHIQAGNYEVGKGTGLDGKAIDKNSVAINVISGDGTKPGDIKGQVVINDVAKASDVGDTDKLAADIKNQNGGQPQSTSVVEAINNLNDKVGDKNYSKVQGKEITDGDNTTTAIGKLNNRMNDIYQTAGQHTTVSNTDKNLDIKPTTDDKGKTNYEINLSKQVNLGDVKLDGEKGSIEAKSIKSDSFTAGNTVVNNDGLKVGGDTYVDKDGVNANNKVIRNVGEGKEDGDAVNVKQVNELAARQGEAITENAAHINQLGQAVNKLDNRINRVGAGAAALAALHPGDYDPDDKLDVSAGVGNYRGANAAAVGLFFHPNERTIFSVAGSMGGGENMVNAGVTLKVGPGHGTPTTVTTKTGQKVDVMDILAKQTEILEKLAGNTKAASAPAGSDIFPDVPQNHWAYAYVDKLYRAGSLAGFSEPGKLKSHMLTRKDFAEILYWAMTNGATTNPDLNGDGSLNRLAAEFGAELKLVVK